MATYNWSYKPGIPNKYGISVPDEADDASNSLFAYVALFGNDVTGNGSRKRPYKTVLKAVSVIGNNGNAVIVIASGVYREGQYDLSIYPITFVGDGDVIIDISYFPYLFLSDSRLLNAYNITFKGSGTNFVGGNNGNFIDLTMDGCPINSTPYMSFKTIKNCVFKNINRQLGFTNFGLNNVNIFNVTFKRCNDVVIDFYENFINANSLIFDDCNIKLYRQYCFFRYSLFYHCNFLVDPTLPAPSLMPLYPSIPENYIYYTDIEDLISDFISFFPSAGSPFLKSLIGDPKFNNSSIGDFTLKIDSPAKNMSYFGTYIGAFSIGYSIKASFTEANGDFDFSSINNLVIDNDSIILDDNSLDGSIETKVKANLIGRELAKAPIFGFNADRNGQYIDSIADLALISKTTTDALNVETPYLVEDAAITYDGDVYQPGEKFTSKTATSFTSDGGGLCREILEAPQRHTILARFSNGGVSKSSSDALTAGYWYYVAGTITYNGVDYTDTVFKAIDTSSFAGSGNVIEAMTDQAFQHYEPGIKFTSNNLGDVRTGEIIRGNGDPDYERGPGKEFPINARFIQLKYIIRVNNLKP